MSDDVTGNITGQNRAAPLKWKSAIIQIHESSVSRFTT